METASQQEEEAEEEAVQRVYKLVRENRADDLRDFLATSPEVDLDRLEVLHDACEDGKVEVVRALIEHKVDVNAFSKLSETPLQIASEFGHLQVVTELLNNNADPNFDAREQDGSCLHNACVDGSEDVAMELIKHGADVNVTRKYDGRSVLHMACSYCSGELVEALLNHGASIEARDDSRMTPLHLCAISFGPFEKLLERNANVNAKCCVDGEDMANDGGETPLFFTTDPRFIHALVNRGADLNAKNWTGSTALHRCCESGHVAAVEALLERNATVDVCDSKGYTPLHYASMKNGHADGHAECARSLIQAGANANAQDEEFGETPLHNACKSTQPERLRTLRALLDLGAHNGLRNYKGKTALDVAKEVDPNSPAVTILEQHVTNRFELVEYAAKFDDRLITKLRDSLTAEAEPDISSKCSSHVDVLLEDLMNSSYLVRGLTAFQGRDGESRSGQRKDRIDNWRPSCMRSWTN